MASMLVALAASASGGSGQGELSEADCRADLHAMHQEVAGNRARTVADLEAAIALAETEHERARIQHEINQAWDHEEQRRALADGVWRDCLAHLRRQLRTQ